MIHGGRPVLCSVAVAAAVWAAAIVTVVPAAGAAGGAETPIRKLAAPAFPPPALAPAGSGGLAIVSTRRNEITDVAAWIRANGLDLGEISTGWPSEVPLPPLPAWAPVRLAGAPLVRAIEADAGRKLLLVYGKDAASCRLIAAHDARTGRRLWAFDLAAWGLSPQTRPAERSFAFQQIVWAAERAGILYVETAHSTYAASSGGRTAYIGAIATGTGKVLWRSPALVANAQSFVLAGDVIVAGYGFTREDDFLTVIAARTGKLLGRVAVRSAPERIVAKGGRLYVRTYDTDVVATLAGAAS